MVRRGSDMSKQSLSPEQQATPASRQREEATSPEDDIQATVPELDPRRLRNWILLANVGVWVLIAVAIGCVFFR
jgi:hypothetical protein